MPSAPGARPEKIAADDAPKVVAKSTESKARELLRQAALRAGQLDDGNFSRKKRDKGLKAMKADLPVRKCPSEPSSRCGGHRRGGSALDTAVRY